MAPAETSREPGLLEHPEAFASFRQDGVARVVCEEKHMGSRAVAVVCRDAAAATRRFGLSGYEASAGGIVYTRTGRRFFEDRALEAALLERLRLALATSGVWDELATDWIILDCELLPWSAKAQELLRLQYSAVGAAATAALPASVEALERAGLRGLDVADLLARQRQRADLAGRFVAAYRRYCWPVHRLEDLKLAPFHLLASEQGVHTDRDHVWHMQTLARACRVESVMLETPFVAVELGDPASEAAASPGGRS
jgi:protein phosphatase